MPDTETAADMIESIIERFSSLDQEKIFENLFSRRCRECYTGPVGCQCWNDE